MFGAHYFRPGEAAWAESALGPAGTKDLQEPYAVFRDAMAGENRVALNRIVTTAR